MLPPEEEIGTRIKRAIKRLIKMQPDIFEFTPQTNQTEWNLVHHLAEEVHKEFPELSCDVDPSKPNFGNKRPDIILHKRGTHAHNMLVIEVKRDRVDMEADLEKIKLYWFAPPLSYKFGAAVVLNEKEFAVTVIRNDA